MAGTDFFTAEVLTLRGLVTYYVLFFIHLESRRVDIAGLTVHPDEAWMKQVARNATMEDCGALRDRRYLLHNRDTKFTRSFRAILMSGRVEALALPARSPNLNAYAERWVRSVKEECLSKVILFGERSLRRVLSDYVTISIASGIIRGRVTSCCFLGRRATTARGLCSAASDWVGCCATIIKRRRDAVGRSSFWLYGIRDHPAAPRSSWQNGYAERLIGSIRRECLDHAVVLGEAHLRRILAADAGYYNELRTHLFLDKESPGHRPIQRYGCGMDSCVGSAAGLAAVVAPVDYARGRRFPGSVMLSFAVTLQRTLAT